MKTIIREGWRKNKIIWQDKGEGKMLEQSREIVTAMCKFRKKVWNREGKMIRWEDHKHAKVCIIKNLTKC